MRLFPFDAQLASFLLFACLSCTPATGDLITAGDIRSIPENTVGSGNGTLNLRMLTYSGSEINNLAGSYNADNGNNSLPNAGGADTSFFAESYFTTVQEVQTFYILNFPDGSGGSFVNEIALFLDLNETGGGEPVNMLDRIDIYLSPTSVQGNPNPMGDILSGQQAAINQVFTGGTLLANTDQSHNLPILAQGAGFADYAIFTGINPFTLNPSDSLLFNMSMSALSNGAEEVFLSGEFAPQNVIPEPSSVLGLAMMAIVVITRRKR